MIPIHTHVVVTKNEIGAEDITKSHNIADLCQRQNIIIDYDESRSKDDFENGVYYFILDRFKEVKIFTIYICYPDGTQSSIVYTRLKNGTYEQEKTENEDKPMQDNGQRAKMIIAVDVVAVYFVKKLILDLMKMAVLDPANNPTGTATNPQDTPATNPQDTPANNPQDTVANSQNTPATNPTNDADTTSNSVNYSEDTSRNPEVTMEIKRDE